MNASGLVAAMVGALVLVLAVLRLVIVARRRPQGRPRGLPVWLPVLVGLGTVLSALLTLSNWPDDIVGFIKAVSLGASIGVLFDFVRSASRFSYDRANGPTLDRLDDMLSGEPPPTG